MIETRWGLTTTSLRRQRDLRVLILSENALLLKTLRVILSAEGFHALPASNGFDAIRVAREQPPLVALIDLDRSGRDALALIRSLRRALRTGPLRVIAVTVDREGIDMRALAVDAVVGKPLDLNSLISELIVQMERSLVGQRAEPDEHARVTG